MRTAERNKQVAQVSELCRIRLLNYADSFIELAKSYGAEAFAAETAPENRQELFVESQMYENRQVMQFQLREMAKLLSETANEAYECHSVEGRRYKRIAREMKEYGAVLEEASYLDRENGSTALVLKMRSGMKENLSAEEAVDRISVALNRRLKLSYSSPLVLEKKTHIYCLEEEPRYLAMTGFSRITREGESVCGDNYSVFEPEVGKIIVLLSDGTGSGEKAGKDSEQVLDLAEKLLEAGYGTEAAVQMVNDCFFVLGKDDKHPTLDICEIDLQQGSFCFRKTGGAASFLKSGRQVWKYMDATLPLGIFRKSAMREVSGQLQGGDYIIMMSDGVLEAFGNQDYEDAMTTLLEEMSDCSPREMAERILRSSLYAAGGHVQDDMTVGVIGILEAK